MGRHVALAFAGIAAALVLGVAAAATAEPRWQAIPVSDWHEQDVVWAAGRVWFVKRADDGLPVAAKSGRVSGSRVGGWVDAKAFGTRYWSLSAVLGQDLVYREAVLPAEDRTNPEKSLRAIELLPNGKLGKPRPVGGAPPPRVSTGSGVIRLPDRPVMAVGMTRGELAKDVGACCDLEGEAVNYRAFVPTYSQAALGLDRRGRVWLAWTPSRNGQKAGMVELDPETLVPRGKHSPIPGQFAFGGVARSLKALVCSDGCRLIFSASTRSGRSGDFSWAAGERTATRLRLPANGTLEAAQYDPIGRLMVAYWYKDRSAVRVGLARGDARGNGLRQASSIEQPLSLPTVHRGEHPSLGTRVGVGVFGPKAYFTFAGYTTYYKATMRAAILGS